MATTSATPLQVPGILASESRLRSQLLGAFGFEHGFFTRLGGVSAGPYASLNFTTATGDEANSVSRNLEIAAKALGVVPQQIHFLSQVHGKESLIVNMNSDPQQTAATEGDIILTHEPIAAAIRTADCVSILIACKKTRWVAACHAGWKGVVRGAVVESVQKLRELGATDLIAAIGPHISVDAFQVSEDVFEELLDVSPDKAVGVRREGALYVDLRRLVRVQLEANGLKSAAIDDVHGCTVREPERFYSFRRDGEASGRLLSAIVGGPAR